MLFFGHIGITLAAGLALKRVYSGRSSDAVDAGEDQKSNATIDAEPAQLPVQGFSGHVRHIVSTMDLRVLIIGAMLPDTIDKPLG